MPELPDVEAQRRVADQHAVGRTVTAVHTSDPQILRTTNPQGLGRALGGGRITAAQRHGKWLWLETDRPSDVLVHFGMTGAFHWHPDGGDGCAHDLVRLDLGDGTFAYNATRKLGGVWLVHDDDERHEVTGPLGVDALGAGPGTLRDALSSSRAALKPALMDQSRIAGIGNLLADELCWEARLHPATPCRDLPDACYQELARALGGILDAGIDAGRVPTTEDFLTGVRDEPDARCPRCGTGLASGTVAGRSTRWCPEEQPDPR